MAKLTRLQIVQRVLSRINAENVTDTSETVEAEEILSLLEQAYEEILEFPWPNLRTRGFLEVTATNNEMKIPNDIFGIDWIRYNGKELQYLQPIDMDELLSQRDQTDSNVDSVGAINDQDPTYWTTYDDTTIIMDAYDGNLVSALAVCQFTRDPGPMTDDADYPDLPARLHPMLVDRTTAMAFATLINDFNNYKIYESMYTKTFVKMKRWARRFNQEESTHAGNYARKSC